MPTCNRKPGEKSGRNNRGRQMSLKKFINDFKSISKDKTKETEIVNFKAQWTFTRG